jgi:lysozyme
MKTAIEIASDLVDISEGCELTAYQKPGDVPTIGWGHTRGVYMGMVIDRDQAVAFRNQDLLQAARGVKRLTNVPLSDNQFAALIDFAFNLGVGRYQSSTLRMRLNRGDYEGAASVLLRYIYCAGQVLPGLVKRRQAEYQLFMG